MINKKAQEEIVGFALIVILVGIILLVFLSFSLRKSPSDEVESYEVESFLQSALQVTTTCKDKFGYLDIQEVIFECGEKESCAEGAYSCDVLKESLEDMLQDSWKVDEESVIKGYSLRIILEEEEEILNIDKGVQTSSSKGSSQEFVKSGDLVEIFLTIYY
jgi:hypothetical protein